MRDDQLVTYGLHMDRITAAIRGRMSDLNLTVVAVATLSGIPYNSLRRKIEHPETFKIAELVSLSRTLRCAPHDLWPAEDGNGAAA